MVVQTDMVNVFMEKGFKGNEDLQIMKKIALAILGLVKESYKISMKRIWFE